MDCSESCRWNAPTHVYDLFDATVWRRAREVHGSAPVRSSGRAIRSHFGVKCLGSSASRLRASLLILRRLLARPTSLPVVSTAFSPARIGNLMMLGGRP